MVLAVLFLIFHIPSPFNLSFLSTIQTQFVYNLIEKILHFFSFTFLFENHSIYLPNQFRIDIIDDCNALVPFLFFMAAVVISPLPLLKKIGWIFIGWIFIMVFNILRIISIVLITDQNKNLFFISHDISTFIIMPLFILTLYWYITKNIDLI